MGKISFWVVFFSLISTIAHAGMDQGDVTKIQKKLSENKSFYESGNLESQGQALFIKVASDFGYTIDFKTKICILTYTMGTSYSVTSVDCQKIKSGYPLIAPLINW
jgi:hypothetical protein